MNKIISYKLYCISLFFTAIFILSACGNDAILNEISSSSTNTIDKKISEQVFFIGEVVEIKNDILTFLTKEEKLYKISIDSFSVETNIKEFHIGDIYELTFSDLGFSSENFIQSRVESFEFLHNSIKKRASECLDQLTIEQKVGQMFLIRMPDEHAIEIALNYSIGGYLWFAKDFDNETLISIKEKVNSIQESVNNQLFMAVDEEGGEVNRISSFKEFRREPFPSPRQEFQDGGWKEVKKAEKEKVELLKNLGFNLNLAPVADVPDTEKDFIFNRSFSSNPLEVAKYVETVVELFKENKVGTVLKHFPGYGGNIDTHTRVSYDQKELSIFQKRDFMPFEAGIAANTESILVSHNVITTLDSEYPASLSKKVHSILRNELGFEGIIMTDDLVMDGLREFVSPEQAAILAIRAGNDILISTEFEIQIPIVVDAVKTGEIQISQINQSVQRILETKIRLGILE